MDAMLQTKLDTEARFEKSQKRLEANEGYSSMAEAKGIIKAYIQQLSDYIQADLNTLPNLHRNNPKRAFLQAVVSLDSKLLALVTLTGMLNSITLRKNARDTAEALGWLLSNELWAARLREADPKLAKRAERLARARHGRLKLRRQAHRSIVARMGFHTDEWSRTDRVRAGMFLFDWAINGLPDVFLQVREYKNAPIYPDIYKHAIEVGLAAADEVMQQQPAFSPCIEPPAPWRTNDRGGFWSETSELGTSFVRSTLKSTRAAVNNAFKDGSMRAHVDGVNALQSVAWTINTEVLDVLQWCVEHDVKVPDENGKLQPIKGLPSQTDLELPPRVSEEQWKDPLVQRAQKYKRGKIRRHNMTLRSQRMAFQQDLKVAQRFCGSSFHTPINCDWRGRIYAIPHFNFAREDKVRALFLFANGMPIGEEGLYWLKVHVANCWALDKIDKAPFVERVKWVDDNLQRIKEVAWQPKGSRELGWWTQADQPFLFLAASLELASAVSAGPDFVTRLPVSFDGSCSGLQHLCAMTRAPEGSLVNLTPADRPSDIYQHVADLVRKRVDADAAYVGADDERRKNAALAKLFLDYGITRKLVKRNVMTFAYSSNERGFIDQHMEDLMEPLGIEVLEGKRERHPFECEFDKDNHYSEGFSAAKYIAKHTNRAIRDVVSGPAAAMYFLRTIAQKLAHEAKPLSYITPTGLPWSNAYYESVTSRVHLHLSDSVVTFKLADGFTREINKEKAANAVSPNLVHALDAAHLLLTVNACMAEGITAIATVHDSFGCLAPQARRFNEIIREQFVKLYEDHDVLAEVREASLRDLTVHNAHMIPEVPARGTLDLKETLHAQFAFA